MTGYLGRMRSAFLPILLVPGLLAAQETTPITGPMPGYADLTEVSIWLQCHGPCKVALAYWDSTKPDSVLRTTEQYSQSETGNALTFRIGDLQPGRDYGYRVELDGRPLDLGEPLHVSTQPLWRWRTDPPAFKVALGSCTYINEEAMDRPGKPYGGGYGIFNSIAAEHPDLMLWMGDNIYLREPDWGSWSGILHRYTHTRALPEMQRLLRGTHHVAIWDDHDFGPNDADGSFVNAHLTTRAFELFWPNPTVGVPGVGGITTMFEWNDIDFFLLDNRTFRVPADMKTVTPTVLGKAQIDWLIQALNYSKAPFKLVALGSQFLSSASEYENYAAFAVERQGIIDRIHQEGITGVVFLTGDRHFSELSELTSDDGNTLYDLTVSPLTSSTYKPSGKNTLLVPGTVAEERNYGTLEFSGPQGDRVMRIVVHDATGKMLWERSIPQPKAGQ